MFRMLALPLDFGLIVNYCELRACFCVRSTGRSTDKVRLKNSNNKVSKHRVFYHLSLPGPVLVAAVLLTRVTHQ